MPENYEIQLLVRADDIGSSHAANEACMKTLRFGIARSVELMAPGAWFPEAARLLKNLPVGCDVGVHLTLTSEWENVKWRPLTHCPSLVDSDGFFLPLIWPSPDNGQCLRNAPWQLAEIENELRAQIELCLRNSSDVTHLSYHMGCNEAHPDIKGLCQSLAAEYQLEKDPYTRGYQTLLSPSEKSPTQLVQQLESIESGKWILIDHPSLDGSEMKSISATDGPLVAVDRQAVTNCWCDPRVLQTIRDRSIQLLSYADLE